MGTRSLTYVYDGQTPIMCMYRQYDGYLSGHGQELANFLNELTLGNGIPDYGDLFTFSCSDDCVV